MSQTLARSTLEQLAVKPPSRRFLLLLVLLLPRLFSPSVSRADQHRTIQTVAGTGRGEVSRLGAPRATNIGQPFGTEIGPDGALYVTEVSNHRVFRLDRDSGELSVVAGSGRPGYEGDGGAATDARLNEPYEVRFDSDGHMFFVEMQNHVVRRVDRVTGVITTVAGTGEPGFSGDGGPAEKAKLNRPHSIALDRKGRLFIADIGNHRIRVVDPRTGHIDSMAGNGEKKLPVANQAARGRPVFGPRALFIDADDGLWVALREGHSIWRLELTAADAIWHHVAGTGQKGFGGDGGHPAAATFNGPKGIAVGPGRRLYVVDTENQVIRMIDPRRNMITTVAGRGPDSRGYAGDGGLARKASLNRPHGICVDSKGRVYIGDSENHRVRVIVEPASSGGSR